ncbi:hypothetical protein [[Mannheimia] succiniciproducens]|uniref:hypothetical protein n=1 Tax=[Mannheimia] succiniciproducens TaxID=157673 RepID=UPI00059F1788|nr:hypothetical protein [[Mannheimia] succiniciproducens]
MIYAGFSSSLTTFYVSKDRTELKMFFLDLIKYLYLTKNKEHKLVSDRLYRKYLYGSDILKAKNVIENIYDDFLLLQKINKKETYVKYIKSLCKALNESLELIALDEPNVKVQIYLMLPYCMEEKKLVINFLIIFLIQQSRFGYEK